MEWRCASLVVLVLSATWLQDARGEDYHPDRTRLIDSYPPAMPTNFLFRGNMPVLNGSFAYSQIISTMSGIIQGSGFTVPVDFDLIVVSYLNIFEYKDLDIEWQFFKNYTKGEFYNIVVIGNEIVPPQRNHSCSLVKELLQLYEKEISYDDLPRLTKKLNTLLTQHPRPALIYSHCEAGTDRTGEVSGAYYLRYLDISFSEALRRDNEIQNRDMYKTSRNALQWYCLYLLCSEGYTHLKCSLPSSLY